MDNRTWHDQKPSHPPVPHAVSDADQRLEQARHEALNPDECTCTPLTDMCPVCVDDNKGRYGGEIPYGDDEWWILKDMRDNTHTEGGE